MDSLQKTIFMDLNDLKLQAIDLDKTKYGTIFTFVDFGNVNWWFKDDVWGWTDNKLDVNEALMVDIDRLASFVDLFSAGKFFYYGFNERDTSSLHLTIKSRKNGFKTITKPIQWIKHYLEPSEVKAYKTIFGRKTKKDKRGVYIFMPKCNFDVELCLDVVRLQDKFDTVCIFTSDSDFTLLLEYLKKQGKKVILVYNNPVVDGLKKKADLLINSQQIKGYICSIKKPKKNKNSKKK